MDGNASGTACVVAVLLSIVVVLLALIANSTITTNWYTSRGYTRTTLPGSQCTHWVKEAK